MPSSGYNDGVFINAPFDTRYKPLFHSIVFAVHDCGFQARCADEVSDGTEIRLMKLYRIIADCKYGIHDLSRTQLDSVNRLPRFNMPLELGLFLGAKQFGKGRQKQKNCLILDKDPYRLKIFCSDIAGQDPQSHGGTVPGAIRAVRDWLHSARSGRDARIPGAVVMNDRYEAFRAQLRAQCKRLRLDAPSKLSFRDYATCVFGWLDRNP
jgi:hypothetical protein